MSISLVAVFFPILLLGGIVGRIFHEFAMTLTIAIVVSLVVSLTVTPMMCAYIDFTRHEDQNWLMRWSRRAFEAMQDFYRRTLHWSLDNPKTIMVILLVAIVLNVYLYHHHPKGFFPDTGQGRIQGGIRGDQTHLLPVDAAEIPAVHGHHQGRPGGRDGGRLCRRPGHQQRQCLHHPEAAGASAAFPADE